MARGDRRGIRDGYGQTETGQLTGMPDARAARGPARWAARCPGMRLDVVDGELVVDPASVPTFFLRYLGRTRPTPTAPPGSRGAPATASRATRTASSTSRAASMT